MLKLPLIAGLCTVALCQQALSDDAIARASADSVAQFIAIAHYCPNEIATNKTLANNYADAFTKLGRQNTDPKTWRLLLGKEAPRRVREIKATGTKAWCENQRRYLEEAGALGVLPR